MYGVSFCGILELSLRLLRHVEKGRNTGTRSAPSSGEGSIRSSTAPRRSCQRWCARQRWLETILERQKRHGGKPRIKAARQRGWWGLHGQRQKQFTLNLALPRLHKPGPLRECDAASDCCTCAAGHLLCPSGRIKTLAEGGKSSNKLFVLALRWADFQRCLLLVPS